MDHYLVTFGTKEKLPEQDLFERVLPYMVDNVTFDSDDDWDHVKPLKDFNYTVRFSTTPEVFEDVKNYFEQVVSKAFTLHNLNFFGPYYESE